MLTVRNTKTVYERLPVWAQNLACSYYGWREARLRFGKEFDASFARLRESEWWSADEIARYEDEHIADIVRHAYNTVPYYRTAWKALGVSPRDIKGAADLHKLPVLTKEDVRANAGALLSTAMPKTLHVGSFTSGTTGKSLRVFRTKEAVAAQWAVWWRHRARFGCMPGDLHVNFMAKPVVPDRHTKPPYWRYNRSRAQYLIGMQVIVPDRIGAIVGFLNSRRFSFYSGYPSIIAELARLALQEGAVLNPDQRPAAVFLGAENTTDAQRRDIEAWTGVPVSDQYGLAESCGNAARCPEGVYHHDFEMGHIEPGNPEVLDGGAIRGDVVMTGFLNPVMPLIRYAVGDTAIWEPDDFRCSCGRHSRSIRYIEGRADDYVITPEGRRLKRLDYLFTESQNVLEGQVIQEELGSIRVVIVPRPEYTAADEAMVRKKIADWISPSLRVQVDYVDRVPREPNGKFRAVKSLISEPAQSAVAHGRYSR